MPPSDCFDVSRYAPCYGTRAVCGGTDVEDARGDGAGRNDRNDRNGERGGHVEHVEYIEYIEDVDGEPA